MLASRFAFHTKGRHLKVESKITLQINDCSLLSSNPAAYISLRFLHIPLPFLLVSFNCTKTVWTILHFSISIRHSARSLLYFICDRGNLISVYLITRDLGFLIINRSLWNNQFVISQNYLIVFQSIFGVGVTLSLDWWQEFAGVLLFKACSVIRNFLQS